MCVDSFAVKFWYRTSPFAKELNRLAIGLFIEQIVWIVKEAAMGVPLPLLHLFSVHDFTLAPLLGAFEVYVQQLDWRKF